MHMIAMMLYKNRPVKSTHPKNNLESTNHVQILGGKDIIDAVFDG